jgi:hypothetical protein
VSIFDKQTEPVFLKDDSSLEKDLAEFEALPTPTGVGGSAAKRQLWALRQGVNGERQVRFELTHSHLPCCVLRDLRLVSHDLTAQIDVLVVTRKQTFVIECKNLYGNITIDATGAFTRTVSYSSGRWKKEGIYSPVTQNQRHLDVLRQIRTENKGRVMQYLTNHYFDSFYESVVVLANEGTILRADGAPPGIASQVVRADHLISHLRERIKASSAPASPDKEMRQFAEGLLALHHPVDTAVQSEPDSTDLSTLRCGHGGTYGEEGR